MKKLLKAEQRIILASTLLVLLTGVLVSVTVTLPMYHSVRTQIEEVSLANARARQTSLESQLGGYQAIAEQFSSRTEIRKRLEAWLNHETSLEDVQEFSLPRLQEPASRVTQLAAMFRISNGETIAALGEYATLLDPAAVQPTDVPFELYVLQDEPRPQLLIKTSSAISTPDGHVIGHDILFFHSDRLLQHLQGFGNYGLQAKSFIYQPGQDAALGLVTTEDGVQTGVCTAELHLLIDNPALQQAGIHKIGNGQKQVLIVQPFARGSTILVIQIPEQVFYRLAYHDLFWVQLLILVLLILSIFVSRQAIKPLITVLSRQTRQLEESLAEQQLAASVFENTREAIVITDTSLNLIRANPAMQKLCGRSQEELTGLPLDQCLNIPGDKDEPRFLLHQLQQKGRWQGEVTHLRNRDGVERTSLLNTSTVSNTDKKPLYYIHIFSDITARTRAERKVRHLATHDALTGLLNRHSMMTHLHQAIARHCSFSILFIDLDKFKPVNDLYGHQAGDLVLRLVAERLRNATRSEDMVARLGGDEFLIMLETPTSKEFIPRVANTIIDKLTQPFDISHTQIEIGVSIGIAHYPEHGDSADALIRTADMAMYCAKRNGGNKFNLAEEHQTP